MSKPVVTITCDHGVRGGEQQRLVYLEHDGETWFVPMQFTAAMLRPMDGDEHAQAHHGQPGTRLHYEIPCQHPRCSRRAYRADAANLCRLLDLLVGDEKFATVFTTSSAEAGVVVTLDGLHYARDTARTYYGLRV